MAKTLGNVHTEAEADPVHVFQDVDMPQHCRSMANDFAKYTDAYPACVNLCK